MIGRIARISGHELSSNPVTVSGLPVLFLSVIVLATMETAEIPPTSNFEFGAQHLRKELHDEFAGQRQYGISTPSANSFMFVFTDPR